MLPPFSLAGQSMEVPLPILRLPTDDTLGSTLGQLGSALATNLNPLNQFRGQSMLQEMQQRQWELQRQQAIDAANANAATVYQRANPLGLSDADLAATTAQIRAGQYDPSRWAEGVTAIGKFRANQTASAAVDSDPDVQGYSPAEQSSIKALVLNGTSLADAKSQIANERLTAGKTSAALNAADAASTAASQPGAPAELGPLARSAAFTDPKMAEALAATGRVFGAGNLGQGSNANMYTDPALSDQANRLTMDRALAGVPVPQGQGPSVALTPQVKAVDTGAAIGAAQAAPRPPGQVVAPTTIDLTTGAVTPAAPAPGAPPVPGQVTVQPVGPNTPAISASTTAEASSKAATDYASAQLQDGISDGLAGRKVLNDVNQLRRLSSLMDNDGMMTQAENAIAAKAYEELGLTLNPAQTAREVFDNYKAALMASWRKDEGVQRLALPEIQLGNISLPSARMSRDALEQSLDAVQARAQLGDKAGQSALKYWSRGATPENAAAFLDERNQIYDPANNPTATIRQTRENQPPTASPALPALKFDPANNRWLHLNPATGEYYPR
jgi:hypothetical protein